MWNKNFCFKTIRRFYIYNLERETAPLEARYERGHCMWFVTVLLLVSHRILTSSQPYRLVSWRFVYPWSRQSHSRSSFSKISLTSKQTPCFSFHFDLLHLLDKTHFDSAYNLFEKLTKLQNKILVSVFVLTSSTCWTKHILTVLTPFSKKSTKLQNKILVSVFVLTSSTCWRKHILTALTSF